MCACIWNNYNNETLEILYQHSHMLKQKVHHLGALISCNSM